MKKDIVKAIPAKKKPRRKPSLAGALAVNSSFNVGIGGLGASVPGTGDTGKKPARRVNKQGKQQECPATENYTKETWSEFRRNGLLVFVNLFLHIFGWCICFGTDDSGNITTVYPARTRYRGFSEASIGAAYVNLSEFMSKNHKALLDEARS